MFIILYHLYIDWGEQNLIVSIQICLEDATVNSFNKQIHGYIGHLVPALKTQDIEHRVLC